MVHSISAKKDLQNLIFFKKKSTGMDVPDFAPNRQRQKNLKEGGWRKYGRTASLSSSSETSPSDSSEDENDFFLPHAQSTAPHVDITDACKGVDKLNITPKQVRFAQENIGKTKVFQDLEAPKAFDQTTVMHDSSPCTRDSSSIGNDAEVKVLL